MSALEAVDDVGPVDEQFVLDDDEAVRASLHAASARTHIATLERRAEVARREIDSWLELGTAEARRTVDQLEEQLERYVLAKRELSGGKVASVKLPGGTLTTTKRAHWEWPDTEDAADVPGLAQVLGEQFCPRIEVVRYGIDKMAVKNAAADENDSRVIVKDGDVFVHGEKVPAVKVTDRITAKFKPNGIALPDTFDEDEDVTL